MAGQIEMIFITSDEDLVRQVSLHRTTRTHIIDLDNGEQIASTVFDKNKVIDHGLSVELSALVRIQG